MASSGHLRAGFDNQKSIALWVSTKRSPCRTGRARAPLRSTAWARAPSHALPPAGAGGARHGRRARTVAGGPARRPPARRARARSPGIRSCTRPRTTGAEPAKRPESQETARSRRRDGTQLTPSSGDRMTFRSALVTKRLASRDHRHSRSGKSTAGFLAEVLRAWAIFLASLSASGTCARRLGGAPGQVRRGRWRGGNAANARAGKPGFAETAASIARAWPDERIALSRHRTGARSSRRKRGLIRRFGLVFPVTIFAVIAVVGVAVGGKLIEPDRAPSAPSRRSGWCRAATPWPRSNPSARS